MKITIEVKEGKDFPALSLENSNLLNRLTYINNMEKEIRKALKLRITDTVVHLVMWEGDDAICEYCNSKFFDYLDKTEDYNFKFEYLKE